MILKMTRHKFLKLSLMQHTQLGLLLAELSDRLCSESVHISRAMGKTIAAKQPRFKRIITARKACDQLRSLMDDIVFEDFKANITRPSLTEVYYPSARLWKDELNGKDCANSTQRIKNFKI